MSRRAAVLWAVVSPNRIEAMGKILRWVIPGSRLLATDRATKLQSSSPPGVQSAQPAACLQPFCEQLQPAGAIRSRSNTPTLQHLTPLFEDEDDDEHEDDLMSDLGWPFA
jgi:hypothetical protein